MLGGRGFIGSQLVEELLNRGYHVVVLDDFSSGDIRNIAQLLSKNPRLELIEDSINNLPLLQNIFEGTDYVFHLAAIASVPLSIVNPEASHLVNATGTLNVLIAARDNHIKKVVYSSSCAVYGDAAVSPVNEDLPSKPL